MTKRKLITTPATRAGKGALISFLCLTALSQFPRNFEAISQRGQISLRDIVGIALDLAIGVFANYAAVCIVRAILVLTNILKVPQPKSSKPPPGSGAETQERQRASS